MTTRIVLLFFALFAALPAYAASTDAKANAKQSDESSDKTNVLFVELKYGRIIIKMHPELAPKHIARIKELVGYGFYNGLSWFRVIPGFMAQTGGAYGKTRTTIPAEINAGRTTRGAVFMSRGKDMNSADSQFFILLADAPHIKGNFTYWGEVISGMDVVDQIKTGNSLDGSVDSPDKIINMGLLSNE